MSVEQLKKALRDAEKREAALTRAIARFEKVAKFLRSIGLKALGASIERKAKQAREDRENVRERIVELKRKIEEAGDVPGIENGWHPDATRTQVQGGIGAYLNVPAKLVWHTTEGVSLPAYSGTHPHFTLNPKTGQLWQHIPIHSGAMALENDAGGVETNRAHAIQVELIGYAAQTQGWSDADYANVAKLARWIEKHAGVARRCAVDFHSASSVVRLSGSAWLAYAGHLGHQHVPENAHWDPGLFKIEKVI